MRYLIWVIELCRLVLVQSHRQQSGISAFIASTILSLGPYNHSACWSGWLPLPHGLAQGNSSSCALRQASTSLPAA